MAPPFVPNVANNNTPDTFYNQMAPTILIAEKPQKLKLPKDWDGSSEKWPLFKRKTEMACQELNLTFLTHDRQTTPETADASKKFAKALHAVVPDLALAEFLGDDHNFYCTRGIEMFEQLHLVNKPTHNKAITAIIKKLSNIKMEKNETPATYKLRIELLHKCLPTNMQFPPTLLAQIAYQGLDERYAEFQANVRAGNRTVETIAGLFKDIKDFNDLDLNTPSTPVSILKTPSTKQVSFTDPSPDKENNPKAMDSDKESLTGKDRKT